MIPQNDIYVWDEKTFSGSNYTLESILEETKSCDFGVFIFSHFDILRTEDNKVLNFNLNVLFEYGLFIKTIGKDCCFIIAPQKFETQIISDLQGIHFETYNSSPNINFVQDTNTACSHIKTEIEKIGPRTTKAPKFLFPSLSECEKIMK